MQSAEELRDLGRGRPTPIMRLLEKTAEYLRAGHWSMLSRFPERDRVNAMFASFIAQPWQYTTGQFLVTAERLLHGFSTVPRRDGVEGIHANCANFATMLQQALEIIDVEDTEVVSVVAKPDELFVTKRLGHGYATIQGEFRCIDRAVAGNVRARNNTYVTEGRCCFSMHAALRVTDKVYDPTLRAVYANGIEDCIDFYVFADPLVSGVWRGKPPGGRDISELTNERPVGFGKGYLLT